MKFLLISYLKISRFKPFLIVSLKTDSNGHRKNITKQRRRAWQPIPWTARQGDLRLSLRICQPRTELPYLNLRISFPRCKDESRTPCGRNCFSPSSQKEAQGTANEKERNPKPGTSDCSDWTLLNGHPCLGRTKSKDQSPSLSLL